MHKETLDYKGWSAKADRAAAVQKAVEKKENREGYVSAIGGLLAIVLVIGLFAMTMYGAAAMVKGGANGADSSKVKSVAVSR